MAPSSLERLREGGERLGRAPLVDPFAGPGGSRSVLVSRACFLAPRVRFRTQWNIGY